MGDMPRGTCRAGHVTSALQRHSFSIVRRRQALGEEATRVVPGQLLDGVFRAATEASNGSSNRLQIHLQGRQPRSKVDGA
jgi:hypothetical protein